MDPIATAGKLIEGLRVLPSYQDARTDGDPRASLTCDECQTRRTEPARQAMGCPYLPRTIDATPWSPAYMLAAGESTSACPGFTTTTPAVCEVVAAYPHWERGTLRDYIGGMPSPALLAGLTALKGGMRDRDDDDARKRAAKVGAA